MTFLANPKLILMRNNMIARQDDMPNANYEYPSNPSLSTNPLKVNMSWLNTLTGEIFVCTDNTAGANVWIGTLGTNIAQFDGVLAMPLFRDSTPFKDYSPSGHSTAGNGTVATVDTTVRDYDTSTGFYGTDDRIVVPHSTDFNFGSGDFTVELFVKTSETQQYTSLVTRGLTGFAAGSWSLMFNAAASNGFVTVYEGTASQHLLGSVNIADGAWHHVAWVMISGTGYLYIDGVLDDSAVLGAAIADITADLWIGDDENYHPRSLTGFIQDVRITKGTGLYTGPFTPAPMFSAKVV